MRDVRLILLDERRPPREHPLGRARHRVAELGIERGAGPVERTGIRLESWSQASFYGNQTHRRVRADLFLRSTQPTLLLRETLIEEEVYGSTREVVRCWVPDPTRREGEGWSSLGADVDVGEFGAPVSSVELR